MATNFLAGMCYPGLICYSKIPKIQTNDKHSDEFLYELQSLINLGIIWTLSYSVASIVILCLNRQKLFSLWFCTSAVTVELICTVIVITSVIKMSSEDNTALERVCLTFIFILAIIHGVISTHFIAVRPSTKNVPHKRQTMASYQRYAVETIALLIGAIV